LIRWRVPRREQIMTDVVAMFLINPRAAKRLHGLYGLRVLQPERFPRKKRSHGLGDRILLISQKAARRGGTIIWNYLYF
jgi:hypothetical protein